MDETNDLEDRMSRPAGPTRVETLNTIWFFRPSALPDKTGGTYLRLPKAESGPREAAGPHLEDGRWLAYKAVWRHSHSDDCFSLLIDTVTETDPGDGRLVMTSTVLAVNGR